MTLDTSKPVKSSQLLRKKTLKKQRITNWLPWLLIPFILGGMSYVVYRQVVIVPRQEAIRKILTVPVERQSLPITVSANGTIKPERSINISPKNAGVLKTLLVKEGDTVKQGQAIAYMDDSNLKGQLMQARGQLAQVEANLQKLIAGTRPEEIAQAKAQLDEALANLQKVIVGHRPQEIAQAEARLKSARASLRKVEDDFRRNKNLYDAGAISLQTLNQKRADRDSVEAQVMEVQQALALQKEGSRQEDIEQARAVARQRKHALTLLEVGTRKEDIDAARAQVISARGSLQNIQTQINDTIIRVPFDGVVTKKFADPGSVVTPTTSASSVSSALSSSILSLASTNQVVTNVAETNIAKIRLSQKVTITADAYPGKTFEGQVNQIAAQATLEQNVTSFEVKVTIISDSEKLLKSGMNVEAQFQVDRLQDALVVPTAAVVRRENLTGVLVAGIDNMPVFVPVEIGVTVENLTEIRSGLKGDEKVLLSIPRNYEVESAKQLS
ncbi:efflux transporter periplasmic adaptor subunit [Scytonema hofmannii PCC 7110]|uniref:Efflux transporter periplasmic adaptor subunit n=1 Tax=Scytonema hofmannii PCC 7110 TaxID=128403 RepID=A0A139XE02_9CYAN|nr:efflux RND transporter periplasmic adaptor subunit [Scytonema hofmannii]KYC42927.1 efflux transporter periplasmic adaptor subunit [Scytonema hofmannii PCC 7110]